MPVLRVAHTPDPDDAFMFYGLTSGAVKISGFDGIEHIIEDIETLNKWVVEEGIDIDATAASAHAYAYLSNKYYLLRTGASMGEGYGPVVVSKREIESFKGLRVGVPGRYTTAYLLLKLAVGDVFNPVFARFDEIPRLIEEGVVDAGLLIHEEQVTYKDRGFTLVMDLWEWWSMETGGLPMPLGVDLFHKKHGLDAARSFREALIESIQYAYRNIDKALEYASRYSRVKDPRVLERFVKMYVNDRTIDMGDDGVEAHKILYDMAYRRGYIPRVELEPV